MIGRNKIQSKSELSHVITSVRTVVVRTFCITCQNEYRITESFSSLEYTATHLVLITVNIRHGLHELAATYSIH